MTEKHYTVSKLTAVSLGLIVPIMASLTIAAMSYAVVITKVENNSDALREVKTQYARKDVLDQRLLSIESSLTEIKAAINDKKAL